MTTVSAAQAAHLDNRDTGGRWLPEVKGDPGVGVLDGPIVRQVGNPTDMWLTGDDAGFFAADVVEQLGQALDGDRVGEVVSLMASKRVSDIAAHLFPGATGVVLSDRDGSVWMRVEAVEPFGTLDVGPVADLLDAEAFNISRHHQVWKQHSHTNHLGLYVLDVASAQRISAEDVNMAQAGCAHESCSLNVLTGRWVCNRCRTRL